MKLLLIKTFPYTNEIAQFATGLPWVTPVCGLKPVQMQSEDRCFLSSHNFTPPSQAHPTQVNEGTKNEGLFKNQ
jgi:hypothetical protein